MDISGEVEESCSKILSPSSSLYQQKAVMVPKQLPLRRNDIFQMLCPKHIQKVQPCTILSMSVKSPCL